MKNVRYVGVKWSLLAMHTLLVGCKTHNYCEMVANLKL